MSNFTPNSFNNGSSSQQINSTPGPHIVNHSQYNSQVGYQGLKQDPNSNNEPQAISNINNSQQLSENNSPAFNRPPAMSASTATVTNQFNKEQVSTNAPLHRRGNVNQSPTSYGVSRVNHPQAHQFSQINANAPPLIPSSQPYFLNHHLQNGPPLSAPQPVSLPSTSATMPRSDLYPTSSSAFSSPPIGIPPPAMVISAPNIGPPLSNTSSGFGQMPGVTMPVSKQPMYQPGPMMPGPPSGPLSAPTTGTSRGSPAVLGPPITAVQHMLPHLASTASVMPMHQAINGPPSGISGPSMGPPRGPMVNHHTSGPPLGGPMGPPPMGPANYPLVSGPPMGPIQHAISPPMGPTQHAINPPMGPTQHAISPPIGPIQHAISPPMGPIQHAISPPMGPTQHAINPPMGPGQHTAPPRAGNIQNRYPPMPQSINQPSLAPMDMSRQYSEQYNTQGLTQQMGQMSVTKQGFDQLWGHQMIDLMQCRHILPEYPEDPPPIKLNNQFADASNCSPEVFRCTVNRIPETNTLLQKSRLPLGILIHPFKDLNHLPVIQCSTIVRCRACRTYINPFVYFVDNKRWKCNLCYRVNDLPEEFQYDPVSKSYGDPSRRPEVRSATIEFIAPGEYMLRPPQPAVYLFLLDVSQLARESGYLQVFCETLRENLDRLPGDARTQVGFICYDAHVHYYLMGDGLTRPKEMTVLDIDEVFLPSPSCLLVNLRERRELVQELLGVLPRRHAAPASPACALGAALQAAHKLMAPTGGRITVFQTCLPNVGPGALSPREDPNARSAKEVAHLSPATDFYKRVALDCSGAQVAVDLFLLNGQYADLATLSGMSKFSAGSVYHIPLFKSTRTWQADQFRRMLTRYLTRKIGFEAVMRVRCTRGISIHTFHGNFFVRSTDLLSLPNVSPDAGFGMQLTIEESLSDLEQVCFQAALLYTSSKGERRIRVHTMALPIASNLTDVLHSADQQCIVGLLGKMAVDRCLSASLGEAREALSNVAADALSAHRLAQNLPAGALSPALHAPASLRLLPLYILALLKRTAFRTGTSTRLDDRVADMCAMKSLPLPQLLRAVYPDLYPVHELARYVPEAEPDAAPDPPRLHLTAERVNSTGAYLLDDGCTHILYVGHAVGGAYLSDTLGVASYSQVADEARALPAGAATGAGAALLQAFLDKLNDDRPYAADVLVLRDNSPSRTLFTEKLVDDRVESFFSYYEFLQHIKTQVK